MMPKTIPPYMMKYYQNKMAPVLSKPDEEQLTPKQIKDQKFNQALDKVKMTEDETKKKPTEKEMSVDEYIELLCSENGSRKDYLNLLNSLII